MSRSHLLLVIFALFACALTVSLLSHRHQQPRIVQTAGIINTGSLNTIWSRPAGLQGAHTPLALGDSGHLDAVDRIDVYYNVSSIAGKSTVLFAYRRSACVDWNRENPAQLFTNDVFSRVVPAGGVHIDVGACYGDTAVPLGVRADMVIAFEPNPYSFHVLQLNALLNPGLNIRPHNFAVGNGKVSELTFTYGGDMCNGGIIGDWKNASLEQELKVQAINLPAFMLEHYGEEVLRRVTLVKIDAEGFDASIISTLAPLLRYSKPLLLVEWFDYYVTSHPHGSGGPDDVHPGAAALFEAIAKLGYTPHEPISGARIPGPQNKHKLPDILCKPV